MHAPQLIIIALSFIAIGIHLAQHGKPREDKYNFIIAIISGAIYHALLYWGGFYG